MDHVNRRLAWLVVAGFALGLGSAALAQPADKRSDTPTPTLKSAAPTPGQGKIGRYAAVLLLDKAQTEAAAELYEAYQAQVSAAGKKTREAVKEAQDDMNAGDRGAYEAKIQKSMAAQADTAKQLTDGFLSDLKSLLTPAQAERWPSFERFRRRERYLNSTMSIGGMGVGGSSVDLIPIIEKLAIPSGLKATIDERLAQYEVDMDRPLQERQRNFEDEQKQMGAVQRFDPDSFAKKQERDRTVDMAIREVNTKYVRQIAAALPEDLAAKLNEAYQAKAYRGIYKESAVSKRLAAASKVKDLSADQRAKLQALIDKYKRDSKAANDRWAAAQKSAEDAGRPTGGGFQFAGPGSTGSEKLDPDFAAARNARRDLDAAAREQIDKLLTPDQLAAIPQPAPNANGARVTVLGDHTGEGMVMVDDVDLGDDAEPGSGGGAAGLTKVVIITVENGGPAHGGGQNGSGSDHAQPPRKP
jgi:hypothetical protein